MALDEHAWMFMPPTAVLSVLTFTAYFAYRIYCLVIAQQTIQPANALGLAWFFLAIEFLIFAPTQLPVLLRSIAFRRPKRPQLSLSWTEPEDVPTVDVIITCCGEDLDVLLDTVRATCNIDYPSNRFRVFLSDDARSAELRDAVESLDVIGPKLIYTAREKPIVKDYKAGNLNHALRFSRALANYSWRTGANPSEETSESTFPSKKSSAATLVGADDADEMPKSLAEPLSFSVYELEDTSGTFQASEYIVGIDADMIPERHILRALLPHMVNDPKMAMACPPQTFYDCPPNDPLIQTMHQFSGVTELVHDSLGHADCLGSGYVMRRAAVEEIGGFPIESLSEDVCCSAKMLGAGWKTCFIPESLQHGSVPESYNAHVKQRTRWFVGHVQTAIMFKLRLFGAIGKHLTWRQRVVGMSFDLKHLVQAPLALIYLALPFTLLCGYPFVLWSDMQQLRILIRLVSVHMLCRWLHQILLAVIARRVNKQFDVRLPSYDTDLEQFISPYVFLAYVRSFILPTKLGGRKTGFTSTGSIASAMDERSKEKRASLPRRLWIVVVHQLAWVHLLFILAIVAGIALTLLRCFLPDGLERIKSAYIIGNATTTHDKLIYLVTRLGWPPLFWMQATVSAMTPFVYAICPPTVPDREELLNRDPKTGIAYPKESSKRLERTKLGSWRYWRGAFVILYTWVLLTGSVWL